MLKYMICGAVALGAFGMTTAAFATGGIYINGEHHPGGGTINVPYGGPASVHSGTVTHGAANCCPAYTTDTSGIVVSDPAVTYETMPPSYEVPATTDSELIYLDQPAVAPAVHTAPAQPVAVVQPVAHHAADRRHGWRSNVYVGVRAGWTSARDTDFRLQGGTVSNAYDDAGYNVSALVGWRNQLTPRIGYRVEGEVGYQSAEIDSHTVGGNTFSGSDAFGDTNVYYGFANLYLDGKIYDRLNAVVGGGIGAGRVEFDGHGVTPAGTVLDDTDVAFGYHLDAGLSYDVTPQLALEAMYRYTSFAEVDLRALDGAQTDVDVDSHNVLIGARYGF